jgi:phage tail-like protein
MARFLPGVYQLALEPIDTGGLGQDTRLAAALDAMEELHDPCEKKLDILDSYVDPRRAPDEFVTYLAGWVDLDWLTGGRVTTGPGRLRELVAQAIALSRWRGTARGLKDFLTAATGDAGFAIDESPTDDSGRLRAFHLRITAPSALSEHAAMIERIIEAEKPASVTYEVTYQ